MRCLLLLSIIFFCGISCQKSDPDHSARDSTTPPDVLGENIYPDLPSVEFFQDNYESATQVLLLKVLQKSTAERIFADDGELGYIVQQVTGRALKVYKGDSTVGQEITYFNFLEYAPGIEERPIDSVLVFLQIDPESGRLNAIDAGQFDWSNELSILMENEIMK